jgi:hypothetical protein
MIGPINLHSPLRHIKGTPADATVDATYIDQSSGEHINTEKADDGDKQDFVGWLKDNAGSAMLLIPVLAVFLAVAIISIYDFFRSRGEDPDSDGDKQPRFPIDRFIDRTPSIRDIEPVDTKETANTFLKRFRTRGPDGLPSGCLKLLKDTMPNELSDEAKELLACATIEADTKSLEVTRALTAYLARFWEKWGLNMEHSGPSMKTHMITAQDSLARGFYQQAAVGHMRIMNVMNRDDGFNELDVEAVLQLHRLTAGMLQHKTYEENTRNPELAKAHLDTACKLLTEEQFELFPPSLRAYALDQKARIVPTSKAYAVTGSGLPPIARTVKPVTR